MPVKQEQRVDYIRLNWKTDRARKVVCTPEDEDRFTLTVEQAIDACKAYRSDEKRAMFRKQFTTLLYLLKTWIDKRKGKIQKAFLTVRDNGLLFLVVTSTPSFDSDLEDELTELDIQIANANEFSEIELDLKALPNCDKDNYESFCPPQYSLEL